MWPALFMLTLVTLLAFSNSMTDNLILDDKAFFGADRFIQVENLGDAFKRGLWGNEYDGKGLYRPLLLIVFELENRLFGDSPRIFHLANVLLHLVATLSLYGFLLHLLGRSGKDRETAKVAALLVTLIFAVHPIHAEVVNSVFNGSSIWVSLFVISGLWWLFNYLETKPARAWLGFGAIYTVSIFFKESALVIPGIAVALIVILTPGSLLERVRRFLPVFWLLIPIAVYFYLRSIGIASNSSGDIESMEAGAMMLDATRLPGQDTLMGVLAVCGGGLKLMLWPHPLKLWYGYPTDAVVYSMIAAQILLIAASIVLFFRGRPGLAAGLSFYYVAMLPASRLISMDGARPHLTDRYLYFPSIGLALALAFLFVVLLRRFGRRRVIVFTFPLILLFSALSWERNLEWGAELFLFETEYAQGHRSQLGMRVLIGSHADQGHFKRVEELCDENTDLLGVLGEFSLTCAQNHMRFNRADDAIHALEIVAADEDVWIRARLSLAKIYISQGKLQEGADHYAYIINRVEKPAHKEMYKGFLLIELYPGSREKLTEAKGHFEKALQLDPESEKAQQSLDHLETVLNPVEDGSVPEPSPDTP